MTEAHHVIEGPAWAIGLPRSDQEEVAAKTDLIRSRISRAAEAIYEIGRELRRIKTILGRRGKWEQWLGEEFEWTDRTAQHYMNVSLRMTKAYDAGTLPNYAPSALYVLAAPSTPESARDEAENFSASGKRITYTGATEIVEKHKAAQEAFDGLSPEHKQEIASKATATTEDDEEEPEDRWYESVSEYIGGLDDLFGDRPLKKGDRKKVAAALGVLAKLGEKYA